MDGRREPWTPERRAKHSAAIKAAWRRTRTARKPSRLMSACALYQDCIWSLRQLQGQLELVAPYVPRAAGDALMVKAVADGLANVVDFKRGIAGNTHREGSHGEEGSPEETAQSE